MVIECTDYLLRFGGEPPSLRHSTQQVFRCKNCFHC